MTESQKNQPETETDAETEPRPAIETDESSAGAGSSGEGGGGRTASPPTVVRRGGATAWFALLIALGAAGGAGYLYWQQQADEPPEDPRLAEFSAELDRLGTRLDDAARATTQPDDAVQSVRSDLDDLREALQRATTERDALRERLAGFSSRLESGQGERQDVLGGLRARIETLERNVGERLERFEIRLESLDGQLDDAAVERGVRLALTEIDSLLRYAENRLALGADRDSALAAWQRAVSMTESLPQGRFDALRDLARDELAQLEAYRSFDPQQPVRRLYAIAGQVDAWPQAVNGERSGGDIDDQASSADRADDASEPGGWRDGLASAFDRLVQVEKVETAGMTRLERERAAAQVRMTLQGAALALARSNPGLAEVLISEAAVTIERAFDTSDPGVASALDWLQAFEPVAQPVPPGLTETRARIARLLGEPT